MSEDLTAKAAATSPQDAVRRSSFRSLAGVLVLLVSVIEIATSVSLKFLLDADSPYVAPVVFFLIGFPVLVALLLFGTLWFRPESLHGSSE